ncbi:Ig-like domain-containing protein [Rhodococcus sp. NPDC059234]|uniref:Ig-like domain-containing protein n=1 Tax=Rhodococcus sp. NPDC059234 TaxID=3346781 RepID=UPI00366E3785
MLQRPIKVAVLAGVIAGGSVLTAVTASAAPAPVTTTSTFQVTCRAVPSAFTGPTSDGNPATVKVTAPPSVAPGETFDVDIDPGGVTIPNSPSGANLQKMSRVKIDMQIPANAEYVSATVTDAGNLTAGKPASLTRVDESGNPSATGGILRLSGGNETIGNGPSSSTNSHAGLAINPQSGASTSVTFPKFRISLKAGASGTIEPKVRTGGAAGNFGSPESFLTFLPQVSHWIGGTIWAPTSCSPRANDQAPLNAGAGPLATIAIDGNTGPVDPGPGTDVTTTLEGPAAATTGEKASFSAAVSPESATGTVQFKVDNKSVGAPRPVVRGIARLDLTFNKAGAKSVTAVYVGADGKEYASAPHVVTVTGGDTGPVDPGPTDPSTPGGSGSLADLLPTGSLGGR